MREGAGGGAERELGGGAGGSDGHTRAVSTGSPPFSPVSWARAQGILGGEGLEVIFSEECDVAGDQRNAVWKGGGAEGVSPRKQGSQALTQTGQDVPPNTPAEAGLNPPRNSSPDEFYFLKFYR